MQHNIKDNEVDSLVNRLENTSNTNWVNYVHEIASATLEIEKEMESNPEFDNEDLLLHIYMICPTAGIRYFTSVVGYFGGEIEDYNRIYGTIPELNARIVREAIDTLRNKANKNTLARIMEDLVRKETKLLIK